MNEVQKKEIDGFVILINILISDEVCLNFQLDDDFNVFSAFFMSGGALEIITNHCWNWNFIYNWSLSREIS